jgi:ATP-binding cassette, subfamily C, bacterial CydC
VKTIRRLLAFLKPLRGWVLLSTLLAAGTVACNIGLLGTSAWLIASAALHPSVADLQVAIVGVRFFGIARGLLRYLERLASHSANFRLLAELRTWFFRKLEPLAPARLVEARGGDLMGRVTADIDGLEDFYVRAVAPPLTALLVTLGMGIFLGVSYPALGAALALGLLVSGAGVPWLARQISRGPGAALVAERAGLNAGLVDGIQGLADLSAFGAEERYFAEIRTAGERTGRAQVRLASRGGLANGLNGLVSNLTLLAMLALAIPLVRSGGMDGVSLAVIALITLASFEATLPLGPAAQRLDSALKSAERLFDVADLVPAVVEPETPLAQPSGQRLTIRNLAFYYAADLPPALHGFSLDLPAGRRIGIVGPSGAGKSSLFNLLLRFWEYGEGSIALDGHELREYAGADVRRCLAVIGAEPYLFSGTLRANLSMGQPGASEEDLWPVLRVASLEGWVKGLPNGLDTWVGERGSQVSGGERQRLALARVLLREAHIWLLDEPTAHLDPDTRQAVNAAIQTAAGGRSLIWISHDLAALEGMDEIIVLQDGRVIERGSPTQLKASGGWYARWSQERFV